jgi:hypothetical protein
MTRANYRSTGLIQYCASKIDGTVFCLPNT